MMFYSSFYSLTVPLHVRFVTGILGEMILTDNLDQSIVLESIITRFTGNKKFEEVLNIIGLRFVFN